jgi:hypothetical protein
MIDPLGKVVSEVRAALQADGGVWPVTVRGGGRYEGDATTSGDTPPLVIIRRLTRLRSDYGTGRFRLSAVSYGDTRPDAAALADRVSDALHDIGPRLSLAGVAIYISREEVGAQAGEDPDTRWPSETAIYIVHAAAQAVTS